MTSLSAGTTKILRLTPQDDTHQSLERWQGNGHISRMPPKTSLAKLEQTLRAHALRFPGAEEAFPWGERAIKVRGKAFLFMRLADAELSFSVKLPRTGIQALALSFVRPTEYGLGKHGWVTVRAARTNKALEQQYLEWIEESFRAVAPKKVVAALDAPDAKPPAAKKTRATARRR
jgi:predicted DNA-binding protein (MmcQ/YjbR family)